MDSSALMAGSSGVEPTEQRNRDTLRVITAEKPLLFDARKIADGGIGVYSQNSIRSLIENGIRVTLLGNPDKINLYPWSSEVEILSQDARRYSFEEMFLLARNLSFKRFSLFHVPHYTLPFGINIPTVITVHDVIHLTHPETFYHRPVAWAWIASGLIRASLITTVSVATEQALRNKFPLIPSLAEKVMVIPNQLPRWAKRECSAEDVSSNIFFVTVSQPKPHKGILDLLMAFSGANDRQGRRFRLVIAGLGSARLAELPDYAAILRARDDMTIIGALSEQELSAEYSKARYVVVPSRAEGFGLMMIEAHAHGVPVICRPVPALKELVTEHDICAADFSRQALERSLISAMTSGTELRTEQRRALASTVEPFMAPALEERIFSSYLKAMGKIK